eukprot:2518352-Amphidinium_carterae.1
MARAVHKVKWAAFLIFFGPYRSLCMANQTNSKLKCVSNENRNSSRLDFSYALTDKYLTCKCTDMLQDTSDKFQEVKSNILSCVWHNCTVCGTTVPIRDTQTKTNIIITNSY